MSPLNIQKKRDFLTNIAYWSIIIAAVYLALQYILPVSVPILFGVLVAWLVIRLSKTIRCPHKLLRVGLALAIYGLIGLLISLLITKGVSVIGSIVKWIPQVYESKLLPFANLIYNVGMESLVDLDPALSSTLSMVLESALSSLQNLVSQISTAAVSLVSGIATGVPNLVLSLLAMIFTTIFLVGDYERIRGFVDTYIPKSMMRVLDKVRFYMTDTLFVVIRSYILIMLVTFVELSILFSIFGIQKAFLKAALIALFDIMPILGTGGIMIPWFVISFALGHTALGLKLLFIYIVVTVVRNYVEPRIVGAQLDLHPIITLVSMFVGLRLFGFWGLFGLPVGISFFWKERKQSQNT